MMTSSEEAEPYDGELKKPCHDCPWRRDAIPGWLGDLTPQEWIQAAHAETKIDCHAYKGPQCAGAAIYRANLSKIPRDRSLLVLPPNRKAVFDAPSDFITHHTPPKPRRTRKKKSSP